MGATNKIKCIARNKRSRDTKKHIQKTSIDKHSSKKQLLQDSKHGSTFKEQTCMEK